MSWYYSVNANSSLSILQGNLMIKVILCHGQDHLIILKEFLQIYQ